MKNAVVTLSFGIDEMCKLTHPTIKAYADKVGADFVVIKDKQLSKDFVQYEKFQIYSMFGEYQRVLFLDSDIIVRPDCPNLFDIVPEHKIGAFNEGKYREYCLILMQEACKQFSTALPKWDRQYYNTGVMLVSRLHRHIFKQPPKEIGKYADAWDYEQPYLNLKIISEGYEVQDLSYKFNRMSLVDEPTGEHRLSSYIVHYAGAAKYEDKVKLIAQDLESWKNTAPEYKYQRNIHVDIGGGLGDQVCAEPVIRFMCENAYKGDNIRIKTDFPRIFKHLPVNILNGHKVEDSRVYSKFQTMPNTEQPIWNFLTPSLCHTVDFSSFSTLRRSLPNHLKTVHLETKFEDLKSLINIIGIKNLTELVLVHPGKGWASKTFPSSYWENVITELSNEFPVAVIGKYISKEQGLVDFKCPEKAVDLRNMLNLDELIALVSQAKVLVSNDSSPVHIAGAFDNWIILIPSCKHPDHVLPYRNGSVYYKTKALFKKLTVDAVDSTPTQIEGQTIDYVVGDIMEYLPDASTIVSTVRGCYGKN